MDFARLLLVIAGDSAGAMKAVGEVNAGLTEMEGRSSRAGAAVGLLKTALAGLLVAGGIMAGIGAVSLKMAADFEQSTEKLHTQAGMTQQDVEDVRQRLLALAPAMGTAPTELSDGFYHIASAATQLPPALRNVNSELEIYQNAVKLSKIGNADLESSTQAVIGVMAAYAKEGMTASEAAAELNAIVGAGDMRMQQLTRAMATGILPSAHQFGLSLRDVGAALATMTDNVTPADEAATRLRMTFSLLAAPSLQAQKALGALGINATQLGYDMRKPDGLLVAVQDLKTHLGHIDTSNIEGGLTTVRAQLEHFGFTTAQVDNMVKTLGPDATEQAFLISKAFGGGRTSAAIMTLLSEFDAFRDKYEAIDKGSAQFGEDWQRTTQNLQFRIDAVRGAMDAWAIQIGQRLTPMANQFLGQLLTQLPALQDWATAFVDRMIPAVTSFAEGLGRLAIAMGPPIAAFLALLPITLSLAGTLLGPLSAGLGFVSAHLRTFGPIIVALTIAWAGWNVEMAVTRAMSLWTTIATMTAALVDFILFVRAAAASEGILTAVQWALNIAMDSNPVGAVAAAIGLLIGLILLLATHWKEFTAAVGFLWDRIRQASAAISAFADQHHKLAAAIAVLLGPLAVTILVVSVLANHWDRVVAVLERAWHWVTTLGGAIAAVNHAADLYNSYLWAAYERSAALGHALEFLGLRYKDLKTIAAGVLPAITEFNSVVGRLHGELDKVREKGDKVHDWFDKLGKVLQVYNDYLWAAYTRTAAMAHALETLGVPFQLSVNVIRGFMSVWNPLVASLQAAGKELGPAFSELGRSVSEAWREIRETVRLAIGQILISLTPLIPAAIMLGQALKAVLIPVLQGLGATAAVVGIIIGALAAGAFSGLVRMLAVAIPAAIHLVVAAIRLFVGTVTLAVDLMTGRWDRLGKDVQNIANAIVEGVTGAFGLLVQAPLALVTGFVQGVVGFFQWLYNRLVGGSIVPELVLGVVQWFTQLGSLVLGLVASLVLGVVNHFLLLSMQAEAAVFGLWNAVVNAFNGLLNSAIQVMETLRTGVVNTLVNLASDVVGKAVSVGSSIASGIAQGITNGVGGIISAAQGAATSAFNAAKQALGNPRSPAPVMIPLGQSVSEGLAAGITEKTGLVATAVKQLMNPLGASSRSGLGAITVGLGQASGLALAAAATPGRAGGLGGDVNVYVTNPAPRACDIAREVAWVVKRAR